MHKQKLKSTLATSISVFIVSLLLLTFIPDTFKFKMLVVVIAITAVAAGMNVISERVFSKKE
jgi:hypothetical protein